MSAVKYRTIVADPPWPYWGRALTGKADGKGSISDFYPSMTLDEIKQLPLSTLAEDNAHLYLWVTCAFLFEADVPGLLRTWDFKYKTLLTWYKTGPTGLGNYFRVRTEHVVFAVRGSLPILPALREQNIFLAANGAHSVKPECFLDLVERVSPGPYLELFARRQRLGWDTWGNEALDHVELAV